MLNRLSYINNSIQYNKGDCIVDKNTDKIYMYDGNGWIPIYCDYDVYDYKKEDKKEHKLIINTKCPNCGGSLYPTEKDKQNGFTICSWCRSSVNIFG